MSLIRSIFPVALGVLLMAAPAVAQDTGTVLGQVREAATLEPISGASISVAGRGGITNDEGRFLITGVAAGTHTLRVTLMGYAETTREVTLAAGQTLTLDLRVETQAVGLGEIVVTSGYNTQAARDLTGVIETVSSDDFNAGRNISPEQLIQGKVAGVQIVDSGEPGGGVAIRIRGGTSINASNDPLFVVDGVPVAVGGGISAGRNPLNFLNPNDIASMTVLKDASATAIYGSRGANGVILIETHTGRSAAQTGGSLLTYSGSVSSSAIAGEPQMMSTEQFLRAVQDYTPASTMDLLGTADTDWRDAVQQTGMGHEHNVALAAASGDLNYRLSVGYLSQEGVLRGTTTERATVGINYGQNFFDNLLRITTNVKGAHSDDQFTPGGVIGNANIFAPTQPIMDPASPYGGYFEWDDDLSPVNPLAELELAEDQGSTLRSLGDIEGQVDMPFLPGLTGTLRLGYDVIKTNRQIFRPSFLFGEARGPTPGFTSHANNTQLSTLLDAFMNYGTRLDSYAADFDFTAGYSYEDSQSEFPYFEARGLEFDYLGRYGIPAAAEQRTTNWIDQNRLISFFGRANATFLDRYLVTLSVRRDGSSRFGPEEQWGTFPSVAVAWRLSDETFLQGFEPLSDLKLRASWGVNGNQAFANYQQFSTYSLGEETAQYQFGDVYVPTIRPGAADPGIKWEETTSWNLGLDFGFLADRFTGALDYYSKETEDLIFRVPVAAGTNLSNFVTTNIGTMRNKGFELTLDARVIEPRDNGFWWDAGFNASTNDNELVSVNQFGGGETILTGGIAGGVGNFIQILRPGLPVNTFYVFRHIRGDDGLPVWEDTNEDGTINDQDLYIDQNGDGTINADDRVPYESPSPKWIFGHTSSMGFGAFDAGFTLRAYLGNHVYNNVASNYGHYRALRYVDVPNNLHESVLETGFEREQYFSDYYVEDASFLRMDNLSLGYTFNPMARGHRVRVFGTAQNLFTLTEYRGVDPLAGLNGIDNNLYPRSRTFIVGANVQF